MTRQLRSFVVVMSLAGSCVVTTSPAWATFHLWKIDEVYSNASGTVQYVELTDSADGEIKLKNVTLTSGSHTFTFAADLPVGTPTAGHHMLLATPGYFAMSGVAPADFNLGVNNFFSTAGATLTYAGGLDAVTFSAAQLPTDGRNSINRAAPGAALISAVNSQTNLAGTSGALPPWENQNNRLDVNGNGSLAAIDALQVINDLIANGIHDLTVPAPGNLPPPFVDVTGDNAVTALDAVQVINALISPGLLAAEPQLTVSVAAMVSVPEPASAALAIVGAGLLAMHIATRPARRRRKTTQTRGQSR